MVARQTITQRIALEGDEEIRRGLRELGEAGQDAFKNVREAARGMQAPLEKFSDSLKRVERQFRDFGTRAQQTGRRIRRIGQDFSLFVTTPITAGLGLAVKAAVDFESAMADVRKVVDFPTPEAFNQLGTDLRRLTQELPLTAVELANIAAAAGQSGVAAEELVEFTELVAQATVAFGLSAEESGRAFARIKTALGLTVPDVRLLADAMNTLANNMAASEEEVLGVVQRVAALGDVAGVRTRDVAAIGAAMVATGVDAERAATGLRNIFLVLSAGASATDSQREAFNELGLSADRVAKQLQTDGIGVIVDLFERLSEKSGDVQASLLEGLFGRRVVDAAAPLINNLDVLRNSLDLVSDETVFAGSAQREFAIRSQTAANAFSLLRNSVQNLAIAFGETLAPIVVRVANAIAAVANTIASLPAPVRLVIGVITALVAVVGPLLIAFGVLVQVIGFAATGIATFLGFIRTVPAALLAIRVAATAVGAAFGLWPAIFAGVIAAVTALVIFLASVNWEEAPQIFLDAWNTAANFVARIIDSIASKVRSFVDFVKRSVSGIINAFRSAERAADNVGDSSSAPGAALARGAVGIRGPGTGTSDSIPAMLSAGESVINARSTANNRGLLQAINSFPSIDFGAMLGALMPQPIRLADGLVPATPGGASRTVNLNLGMDGRTFGLTGDQDVVDSLIRHTRDRTRLSAGRKPNWYK